MPNNLRVVFMQNFLQRRESSGKALIEGSRFAGNLEELMQCCVFLFHSIFDLFHQFKKISYILVALEFFPFKLRVDDGALLTIFSDETPKHLLIFFE